MAWMGACPLAQECLKANRGSCSKGNQGRTTRTQKVRRGHLSLFLFHHRASIPQGTNAREGGTACWHLVGPRQREESVMRRPKRLRADRKLAPMRAK